MKSLYGFLAVSALIGASQIAKADTFTFDFNGLTSGAGNSTVQSYMQGVLGAKGTVSVTGGAQVDHSYNGDGHVVGPCAQIYPYTCTSTTLGTDENSSTDMFIKNNPSYTSFSFTFSGLNIVSVGFDYEIFPDGTCPVLNSSSCGGSPTNGIYPNQPDFTFSTNLGTVFHAYGTTPTSPNNHSPNSGAFSTEKAPQLLVEDGIWTSPNVIGATTLTFKDWPATIAIDNLVITTRGNLTPTPEPGSIALLLTAAAGIGFAMFRRRAQQ